MTAGAFVPPDYLQVIRDPSLPVGGGRATFIVSGELDLATMGDLVEAVAPDAVLGAQLIIDLSGLSFMDGSGIRALIGILNAVGPHGRLTIRQPSPPVRRVLALVGADRLRGLVLDGS